MIPFIVISFILGYLIYKKIDESEAYITTPERKPRNKYRDLVGYENQLFRTNPDISEVKYTKLGIPMTYFKIPNGTILRLYGDRRNNQNTLDDKLY